MGMLALAGMVSGAGQAMERGLTQMQGGIIQHSLQESSQKFQSEKLKEQMAHAERLSGNQIAAAREDAKLGRDATKENLGAQLGAQKEMHADDRTSRETMQGKDITSKEGLQSSLIQSHEKISAATNAMHKRIAELDRAQKGDHFDKTFTQAKITGATSTIATLKDEVRYAQTLLANPLADKNDPSIKAIEASMKESQALLRGFESKVAQLIGATPQFDAAMSGSGGAPKKPVVSPYKQ